MMSAGCTPFANRRRLTAVCSAVLVMLLATGAEAQTTPSSEAPTAVPPAAHLGVGTDSGFAFTERSRLFGEDAKKAEKADERRPTTFSKVVPEPSTLAMMLLGLAAITVARQRQSPSRTPPSKRRPTQGGGSD